MVKFFVVGEFYEVDGDPGSLSTSLSSYRKSTEWPVLPRVGEGFTFPSEELRDVVSGPVMSIWHGRDAFGSPEISVYVSVTKIDLTILCEGGWEKN